jgi:uridine kinase
MVESKNVYSPDIFSEILYEVLKRINVGVEDMELYEFRYALNNWYPGKGGWASVELEDNDIIEARINDISFYTGIQLKPRVGDRIVLDKSIVQLTLMLFVGLVTGKYSEEWVRSRFYFDTRGFFFLSRTFYFTDKVVAHFGGKPYQSFEQKQQRFDRYQEVGYKEFKEANAEVDQAFQTYIKKLVIAKGTPLILTIAGPTAAGKTEIVEQLSQTLNRMGKKITSIEMDNFLTDRDYREEKGIYSLGKEAVHFDLFKQSLEDITRGKTITIPRYDFVYATSSHDLNGNLKAGCTPLEVEPADIVFVEGNFSFQLEEVAHLIGIKVVYLTDDAIRLKRKWKRDIDYRKKYDSVYFCNRFFRTQFLRAHECYLSQMEVCDLVVDTTGAKIWATSEIAEILSHHYLLT